MNIKTSKKLLLITLFSLTTACSTSGGSGLIGQMTPGNQNNSAGSSAGGQSMPGSQLMGGQNSNKKITAASSIPVRSLPTVPQSTEKMRKIVLKAPPRAITSTVVTKPTRVQTSNRVGVTTSAPRLTPNTTNRVVTRPSPVVSRVVPRKPVAKPVVTQPYRAPVTKNPVRPVAAVPARPVATKPQSTVRRLTLNGSANFKSGSSRLTNEGQTKLLALALSLQEGNTRISRLLIEGHTDSVGDAAMNQVLSLKRANAVAEYLASKGGFPRSSMRTLGLGESKPVADNKTRKGRAQNRRVEITATGTRQFNR